MSTRVSQTLAKIENTGKTWGTKLFDIFTKRRLLKLFLYKCFPREGLVGSSFHPE